MRKYYIIIGSKQYFNEKINKLSTCSDNDFLNLVRKNDALKNKNDYNIEQVKTEILIVRNSDYHGIVASAHDRLSELIKELTFDDSYIYIHNPPSLLNQALNAEFERGEINLSISKESYDIKRNKHEFLKNIYDINKNIYGQSKAIAEIAKSIWYLSNVNRKKPYVIMLYGKSSLGKTEIVREIASKFYNNKFMEKHLSMFKNINYTSYFFGNEPNRISLGFELLERESNLIFLDEFDKCSEIFYSAFYTLFDNTIFKDLYYDVDISGTFIILTANYNDLEEMKNALGLPIYYRIDKFIHFEDFDVDTIHKIVLAEIHSRADEFKNYFSEEKLYEIVSKEILVTQENARTIKAKIQKTIENMLFDLLINKLN